MKTRIASVALIGILCTGLMSAHTRPISPQKSATALNIDKTYFVSLATAQNAKAQATGLAINIPSTVSSYTFQSAYFWHGCAAQAAFALILSAAGPNGGKLNPW